MMRGGCRIYIGQICTRMYVVRSLCTYVCTDYNIRMFCIIYLGFAYLTLRQPPRRPSYKSIREVGRKLRFRAGKWVKASAELCKGYTEY